MKILRFHWQKQADCYCYKNKAFNNKSIEWGFKCIMQYLLTILFAKLFCLMASFRLCLQLALEPFWPLLKMNEMK